MPEAGRDSAAGHAYAAEMWEQGTGGETRTGRADLTPGGQCSSQRQEGALAPGSGNDQIRAGSRKRRQLVTIAGKLVLLVALVKRRSYLTVVVTGCDMSSGNLLMKIEAV